VCYRFAVSRIVHTAPNEATVRLVCDLLDSRGIRYRVNGASLVPLRGALPFGDAAITVEVLRDEDIEPARALLAELDDPNARAPWPCGRCGEENPGSFDVCWKCRAAAPPEARDERRAAPYRGVPAPQPAVAPAPVPSDRAGAAGDLIWAVAAGCAPVALTVFLLHGTARLATLTPAGRSGLIDIVAALELLVCLRLLARRGVRVNELWGGRERWISDSVAAIGLAVVVFVIRRAAYRLLMSSDGPAAPPAFSWQGPADAPLEWLLMLAPGLALSAAQGSLLLYGVVLARSRALFRSRVAAVILTSLLAALMWAPGRGLAAAGSVFAGQIFLCGGFLVVRRVWPMALATAGAHAIVWLLPLLRG
jgi:hypothetical protein